MSTDYTYVHAQNDGRISDCDIHTFQQASAVTPIDIIANI